MGNLSDTNYKGNYIVGAYATSPNLYRWDEVIETQYFDGLKKISSIRGLELPFWGDNLHPFDDNWLLEHIHPSWVNVLTCVPGTMKNLKNDPDFGLASKSNQSRDAALKFYQRALAAVKLLNNHFGKKTVTAVNITSSPTVTNKGKTSSQKRFLESLSEIVSWDWSGARIVVEHCDAFTEGFVPQKGFLSLESEIEAILEVNYKNNTNLGITLNWARSVIEKRDVNGAVDHASKATKAGLLSGLMFSGVTDKEQNIYGQWADNHMPPAWESDMSFYEKDSLMTAENMQNTLNSCNIDMLDYIGIKLLAMPEDATLDRRIGLNRDAMRLLDRIITQIRS